MDSLLIKVRWHVSNVICLSDSDYFEFLNGLWTGKKKPFVQAKVIRNTNFTNSGRIDWSDIAELQVEMKQLSERQLQTGDIIIERSGGGPKQPVGRVVLFEQYSDETPYSFSNFTSVIRIKDQTLINPYFLNYYLLYYYQNEGISQHQSNTTGLRNLNFSGYKSAVFIPAICEIEQKKIIHVLGTLQKAIQKQEAIIATTQKLKKSLLSELFTNGTKGETLKQTEIGLVPKSWDVVPVGTYIKFLGGYAFKSSEVIKQSNTQLVRMGNLYQNKLDLTRSPSYYPDTFFDVHKRYVLNTGDLIMSLTGTMGKEDYGFTVEVPEVQKKLLLNQRVAKLLIDEEKLDRNFVRCFMLSRLFLDNLYPTAQGTKQANLSTTAIQKLPIVIPHKEEQKVISQIIISLEKKVTIAERKKKHYENLFKTFLHDLMTGSIRVNNIDFHSTVSTEIGFAETLLQINTA